MCVPIAFTVESLVIMIMIIIRSRIGIITVIITRIPSTFERFEPD